MSDVYMQAVTHLSLALALALGIILGYAAAGVIEYYRKRHP